MPFSAIAYFLTLVSLLGCGTDPPPTNTGRCEPTACSRQCATRLNITGTCDDGLCVCATAGDASIGPPDVWDATTASDTGLDAMIPMDHIAVDVSRGDGADLGDDHVTTADDGPANLDEGSSAQSDVPQADGTTDVLSPMDLWDSPADTFAHTPDVTADAAESSLQDADSSMNDASDAPETFTCGTLTTCNGRCVDLMREVGNCGACGSDCRTLPGVDAERVGCSGGVCRLMGACNPGRGDCNSVAVDGCEANLGEPRHCGSCSVLCAEPTPTCSMGLGRCTSGCSGSAPDRCDAQCVSSREDVRHCGGCGIRCPLVANAQSFCRDSRCGHSCNTGFHACGDACRSDDDPQHCGTGCVTCPRPPNASAATCIGGTCGFTCAMGYDEAEGACAIIRAPRPVAPMSALTVTSHRPLLRWALGAGTDGARVELYRDRACTQLITTFNASGQRGSPSVDLPRGTIFWRLRGRLGSATGSTVGPTWHFRVGAQNVLVQTAGGGATDVDGDGRADLIVATPGTREGTPAGRVFVYRGINGIPPVPDQTLTDADGPLTRFGYSVVNLNDVNGDGFGDVAVLAPGAASNLGRIYVFHGGSSGLLATPATHLTGATNRRLNGFTTLAGVGDVNDDGYSDLGVADADGVRLFFGGTGGIPQSASRTLLTLAAGRISAAGDVNGDGVADVALSNSSPPGAAEVFFGGVNGFMTVADYRLYNPDASDLIFSQSIAGAGDINGDGYADVAISAPFAESEAGRVRFYAGGPSGLSNTPIHVLTGESGTGERLGSGLGSGGDFNGDGYGDYAIGASAFQASSGRIHFYLGGPVGLDTRGETVVASPDGLDSVFGSFLGHIGDTNEDDFADLVVSSYNAGGDGSGRVRMYFGTPRGIQPPASRSLVSASGSRGNFGYGLALSN